MGTTKKSAEKAALQKSRRKVATKSPLTKRAPVKPSRSGLVGGDLLALPLARGGWGACLILGRVEDGLDVVSLAWTGDEHPTAAILKEAGPLFLTHHGWGTRPHEHLERHQVGDETPPTDWRKVGTRALPKLPKSPPSGNGWRGIAYQIGLQRAWDVHVPQAAKDAYRKAEKSKAERRISVGGPEATLSIGASHVEVGSDAELEPPPDGPITWSALDPLAALHEITFTGSDPGLTAWLATRPILMKLMWDAPGLARIDLAKSRLSEVMLGDLAAVEEIVLAPTIETLSLRGAVHPRLRVRHPRNGRGLSLIRADAGTASPVVAGLEELEGLEVWGCRSLAAGALEGYRELRSLSIHGGPETDLDPENLAGLRRLERLELRDLYAFDFATLPVAAAWPSLRSVEISGLRKTAVPLLKERLAGIADVAIRGGKSDEWLTANLDNPFRDWVDQDASKGRAAARSWTKRRTEIGAAPTPAKKKAVLKAFIGDFNALDAKQGLDTIDREETAEAFAQLADAAGFTRDEADELFAAWRDF